METIFISDANLLLKHFEKEIADCKSFRFAVAWASTAGGRGKHWQLIDSNQAKLTQAIVGIQFHQTEPEALFQLHKWNKLNIVYDTAGVFHPKFYLFENESSFSLITGSSNFTAGGFHKNTESNVLIKGNKKESIFSELEGFYRMCKEKSRIPDKMDLVAYQKEYERANLQSGYLSTYFAPEERHELITKAGDSLPDYSWENIFQFTWDEYVHGLKYLSITKYYNATFYRLNEEGWRTDTVYAIDSYKKIILEYKTLSNMPEEERKAFCGTLRISEKYGDSGWLGSMTGAGYFKQMVINEPKILDEFLNLIPIEGSVSEDSLNEYLSGILSIENVGSGIALRLLSAKRPDLFLSINKATGNDLFEMTGLKGLKNSQKKEEFIEAYIELHRRIYRSPWFQFNLPTDGLESKIAKYRVALLDCFFYEG
ncbi:MAG: phospholipase D family protein [Leptospiraceae bacterium]|nr:phospholipase D family protein [Leptospiraceae bacterium]